MRSVLHLTKDKLVLISAIVIAALIGSLTSAAVLAAIPDSSGKVNTCYNNLTKVVRVTDPAGNCGAGTTALSWDQNGWKGYGYIKANGTLDAARSKNVISAVQSTVYPTFYCLTVNGSPLLISSTGLGGSPVAVVRGADAQSDDYINSACGASANAIVGNSGVEGEIYFFFR